MSGLREKKRRKPVPLPAFSGFRRASAHLEFLHVGQHAVEVQLGGIGADGNRAVVLQQIVEEGRAGHAQVAHPARAGAENVPLAEHGVAVAVGRDKRNLHVIIALARKLGQLDLIIQAVQPLLDGAGDGGGFQPVDIADGAVFALHAPRLGADAHGGGLELAVLKLIRRRQRDLRFGQLLIRVENAYGIGAAGQELAEHKALFAGNAGFVVKVGQVHGLLGFAVADQQVYHRVGAFVGGVGPGDGGKSVLKGEIGGDLKGAAVRQRGERQQGHKHDQGKQQRGQFFHGAPPYIYFFSEKPGFTAPGADAGTAT